MPAGSTVKCKPWPFVIVKESLFSRSFKGTSLVKKLVFSMFIPDPFIML